MPLKQRDAIFPEDFRPVATARADVLVTHEAPSSHGHGFVALDDLSRGLGTRLVVHGHHHESCTGVAEHGIRVIGLGRVETLLLREGDLT